MNQVFEKKIIMGSSRRLLVLSVLLAGLVFSGCARLPEGVSPVVGFELERYLGTWYEIARLDHSFERGLSRVSATYSLNDDGSVRVVNRGYSETRQRWQTAEGRARFVGDTDLGYLKVSFFGPFYGAYVVIELDRQGYQYALVCGPNREYLWLLARQPRLDAQTMTKLTERAAELGFPVEQLIVVSHE